MNSAYWDSQYNYYMTNQPPKPESYYNKDFVQKINEARSNIDNLVAERDKSWAAQGQARDEYDAFSGSMRSYGDVYKEAENEFGVKVHQDEYEKSKKALALAESTMATLPSTINASSNRVLTQEQRERQYNVLADRHMAYKTNLMAKTSAYEDVWKKARKSQEAYTMGEMATQYGKLGDYNNAWMNSIKQYTDAYKKMTQAKIDLINWESDYRNWQHQQYENAQTVWFQNMSNALTRWIDAKNTELAASQAEYIKRQSDRQAKLDYAKDRLASSLVNLHWAQQALK